MAIYAVIKKGDQRIAGKENSAIKEGQVVYYHDEDIPDHGPITSLSSHMKKVYVVVKIPNADRDNIRDWVRSIPDPLNEEKILYKRKVVFDLKQLASDLGRPSLYDDWAGSNSIEPVDGSKLHTFFTSSVNSSTIDYDNLVKNPPVKDTNAITSGVWSIGSGGDYATTVAYEADFGTPTGILTGQYISNVTETARTIFNVATSYSYILNSDTPHNGDQTAGWTVTQNNTGEEVFLLQSVGGNGYEIYDFTFKRGIAAAGDTVKLVNCAGNEDIKFHDLFFDGNSLTGSGLGARMRTTGCEYYNIGIWGFNVGSTAYGFRMQSLNSQGTIENIFVYDCVWGFDFANTTVTVQNLVSFASSLNYRQVGNVTGDNCISDDTTIPASGTNQHTSLTISNEVDSTDDTDGDLFMFPKVGGNMEAGGKTPTVSTAGMKGTSWDGSTPSIGAFQYALAPGLLQPQGTGSTASINRVGLLELPAGAGSGGVSNLRGDFQ